ncbi:MAG: hypothetical protein ABIH03_00955, partial [Pseudomonadota bacterium]
MPQANLGTLAVTLRADTARFVSDMDVARAQIGKIADAAKTVAVISGAAFAGLAGGIGAAMKAASGQRSAEIKLAAAIRGTGAAIDASKIKEYAGALQKVTTFGDEATISAAAMLTTFQLTEDQVLALMPRVQNLSAMYGMDLNSAALTVGRSLTAGAGALSRYGITLSEVQKEAFETGNQMQKVAVLMQALDANTGPAAAALANTGVGAFVQMKNAANDLVEELGFLVEGPMISGFKKAQEIISELIARFQAMSPETKKLVGESILVATAIAGVVTGLAGIAAVLPSVIAGFGALLTFSAAVAPAIAGVGVAIATASVLTVGYREVSQTTTDDISLMWKQLGNDIKESVGLLEPETGGVLDTVRSMFVELTDEIGDLWGEAMDWIGGTALGELIGNIADFVGESLKWWGEVGQGIKNAFIDAYDYLSSSWVGSVIGVFASIWKGIFTVLIAPFKLWIDGIGNAIGYWGKQLGIIKENTGSFNMEVDANGTLPRTWVNKLAPSTPAEKAAEKEAAETAKRVAAAKRAAAAAAAAAALKDAAEA